MRSRYLIYGCFFLCGFITKTTAQSTKNITRQQVMWYAYINVLEVNPKLTFATEIHERRYFAPDAQHQFVARERMQYTLGSNWDVAACFAYFLQSPNDPLSSSSLVIPELRPHIDINNKQILKKITITHRYRIEGRFIHNSYKDALTDGYTFNWRFRYQLAFEIPLLKFKNEGGIKFRLGDEILINAGKNIKYNTFDNNRIFASIVYSPVKKLAFEAGYMNWFQQRSSGIDYYERDIIRLSLTHRVTLKKKSPTNDK